MIEGLDRALEAWAPDAARELLPALEGVLGGPGVRGRLVASEHVPRNRVRRLRVELDAGLRGLILKRFPPQRAARERAAIERWLPRAGLAAHGPPLLATAADRAGQQAWFVYEDLGPCTLADHVADRGCVRAAAELLAELHTRFREHPLLGEARCLGADLGIAFFATSVRDAARALEPLAERVPRGSQEAALCARLLARLAALRAEQSERAAELAAWGGPETLLHGDPWTINVLVRPADGGFEVRLIDWDHCGVGPASYDLSAFLLRFPPRERSGILAWYGEHLARHAAGDRWPTRAQWNALFDTAESARLAHTLIWRALAGLEGHSEWALEELSEVEEAFATLAPVLPDEAPAPVSLATAAAGDRACGG